VLEDYRQAFEDFSGLASQVNRQLAFAGIALIWLFKRDVGGVPTLPHELLLPAVLIGLALAFDLLQYSVASVIWYCFYRLKEEQDTPPNKKIDHPVWLERPITLLALAKIILTMSAYAYLIGFLWRTFVAGS
jgi:hypothetical protein